MKKCDYGFIGLGKMGLNLVRKMIASGHKVCVYDKKSSLIAKMLLEEAQGCSSIGEVPEKIVRPRVIVLCLPAGKLIDEIICELLPSLSKGDTIVDLSNSFYKDTQRRAKSLGKQKVNYIDVGVSGGVAGARMGACLMIGGDKNQVNKQRDLFQALSKDDSYMYIGRSGAGHLVKGYHNLIEYGYLQSLAEGLAGLSKVGKKEGCAIDLREVCEIWSRGSIIESRLLNDAKQVFNQIGFVEKAGGSVYGQTLEEMKKLVRLATKAGVKVYSCAAAVKARLETQKKPTFSGQIINAIRNVFGGHQEWNK